MRHTIDASVEGLLPTAPRPPSHYTYNREALIWGRQHGDTRCVGCDITLYPSKR